MLSPLAKFVVFSAMFFFLSETTIAAHPQDFIVETGSVEDLGLGREKLTHLHFYIHNIYGESPITSKVVVNQTANPSFGTISLGDAPMTLTPDLGSQRVGSMQMHVAIASLSDASSFLMTISFIFKEGRYNGSSVVVVGTNRGSTKTRELPIVGGSGVFRFARGYVLTSTYSSDPKRGNDIYEYDLYVVHP